MKSKRQEEPQKKTLSPPANGWSEFFQQNATRILLGLTLVVLAILIIRYRNASTLQQRATARAAASRARNDVARLKYDMLNATASPEALAAARDQTTLQALSELSEALADSADSDTDVKSDAYATRGDLYWTLANYPVLPGAATRPSLATKDSPETLTTEAEADYRHVIDVYPNELMNWATAQFGLAAIAENRSDWAEARKRYEEIEKRAGSPDMLKQTAQIRMSLLDRIRQPVLVGPYPTSGPGSSATASLPPLIAAPVPTTAPSATARPSSSPAVTQPTTR